MTKLTGEALLQHRKDCRDRGMSNKDTVIAAGYRDNGRIHFTEYYENILIAKGTMWRIQISIAKITPHGVITEYTGTFTTSYKSQRTINRIVREHCCLTGKKCHKTTAADGSVALYHKDMMVLYQII